MTAGFFVRDTIPEDEDGLNRLMELCPEQGAVTLSFSMLGSVFQLNSRFGQRRRYTAMTDDGEIVGMGFSDLLDVHIDGGRRRGAYFSGLRTHPAWRRKGVASSILEYRQFDARQNFGAEVFWAGIMGGNQPSFRTLHKSGFQTANRATLKMVFPHKQPPWRADPAMRPATNEDISWLVTQANTQYGHLNFWCLYNVGEYLGGLHRLATNVRCCQAAVQNNEQPSSPPAATDAATVWILADQRDRPRAAMMVYNLNDIIVPTISRVHPALRALSLLLRLPMKTGAPLRTALITDVVARHGETTAVQQLARGVAQHYRNKNELLVLFRYPGTPSTDACRALKGMSTKLDLLCKTDLWVNTNTAVYMETM